MRWILFVGALALALLIGAGVTFALEHRQPASALTADLKGSSWAAQSADFDGRIRARFPKGTPEQQLITELEREGFKADWPWVYNEHQAVRREDSWACGVGAYAIWQVDPAKKLVSIRGVYEEEGCL